MCAREYLRSQQRPPPVRMVQGPRPPQVLGAKVSNATTSVRWKGQGAKGRSSRTSMVQVGAGGNKNMQVLPPPPLTRSGSALHNAAAINAASVRAHILWHALHLVHGWWVSLAVTCTGNVFHSFICIHAQWHHQLHAQLALAMMLFLTATGADTSLALELLQQTLYL